MNWSGSLSPLLLARLSLNNYFHLTIWHSLVKWFTISTTLDRVLMIFNFGKIFLVKFQFSFVTLSYITQIVSISSFHCFLSLVIREEKFTQFVEFCTADVVCNFFFILSFVRVHPKLHVRIRMLRWEKISQIHKPFDIIKQSCSISTFYFERIPFILNQTIQYEWFKSEPKYVYQHVSNQKYATYGDSKQVEQKSTYTVGLIN